MHKKEFWIRKKLSKIYIKIFVSFSVLAIPVFLISFFMFSHASSLLRNEFKNKLEENFLHNINELDSNLSLTRTSLISIFYNPDYLQFFQPYDSMTPDVKVNVKQIINVMANAKAVSSDHLDAVFYYMDDNKVFNREGVDDFEIFFSKFHVYEGYPSEYWKSRLNESIFEKTIGPVLIKVPLQTDETEKKVIAYETTVPLNGKKIKMVIDFKFDKVVEAITANSLFSETCYVVLDTDGKLVYSTLPKNIPLVNIESTLYEMRDFFVNDSEIKLLDYKVLAVTPVKTFDRYISGTFLLLLSACIVFAIAGVFIAIAFSNSICRPINRISEFVSKNTGINLLTTNNYSEFDIIESGIEYLVEQNDNYKDKMLQVMEKYVEASIINSINNEIQVNKDLFESLFTERNDLGENFYSCISIIFSFTQQFHDGLDDKRKLYLLSNLKPVIYSAFSEALNCVVIEYDQGRFICIVGSPEQETGHKLNIAIEKLNNCFVDSCVYFTYKIGIGQAYSDLQLLRKSYIQSATALVKAYYKDEIAFCTINESEAGKSIELSREDGQTIIQLLEICDYGNLENTVTLLVKKNISRCLSHERMILFFMNLAQIGLGYIRNLDYEYSKQLQEYTNELKRSIVLIEPDYSDKIKMVMDLYVRIIEHNRYESDKKLNNLFAKIKSYICEHYMEDLYLENVSSQFNISPKYLSRRFKELENANFIDFVNSVRIEKAQSLLKETDLKVEDIAERVGLPSKTTFIRLFKKYTSIIPSQYRSIHSGKKTI